MSNLAHFMTIMIASLLFPVTLLFVRKRVRDNRQRLIDELGVLFFDDPNDRVAPFDYARAKYEMRTMAERRTGHRIKGPPGMLGLAGAAAPYVILSMVGFAILLIPIEQLIGLDPCKKSTCVKTGLLVPNLFWTMGFKPPDLTSAAAVFGAAFLGAYLMTTRQLLRAVQNYELSQLQFVQCAAHMAFGMFSGLFAYFILSHASAGLAVTTGLENPRLNGLPLWIGLAFLGGYVPDYRLSLLSRWVQLSVTKTVDNDVLAAAKIIPLEVIEGIDTDIRIRLEQFGLYDVQNLAVANPLLMYIETPYSFYETFDWVLQAQLCSAAGIDSFKVLRTHKIRTSLDLERAMISNHAVPDHVMWIGRALFGDDAFDPKKPGGGLTVRGVQHAVMVMLDDLHVHRIRELWELIFNKVTNGSNLFWLYRDSPELDPAEAEVPPADEKPEGPPEPNDEGDDRPDSDAEG